MNSALLKPPSKEINGGGSRAKWKSEDDLARLRFAGFCFRCERRGCMSRVCPLLPAIRPQKFKKCLSLRTSTGKDDPYGDGLGPIDPNVYEEDPYGDGLGPIDPNVYEEILDDDVQKMNFSGRKDLKLPIRSPTIRVNTAAGQEIRMNTPPFLVNALLNDTMMVQALIDNGCLCSGIIDDALTTLLNLPRIKILPQALETAEMLTTTKPIIDSITFISLDLDGHVTSKLWLYVVPQSTHKMILGKKWLEEQDAIIHSKDQQLELRKAGITISSVQRWREDLKSVTQPRYASVNTITSMVDTVPVCKASIEDISKALRGKPQLSVEQARERLPEEVKDFAHLFADVRVRTPIRLLFKLCFRSGE